MGRGEVLKYLTFDVLKQFNSRADIGVRVCDGEWLHVPAPDGQEASQVSVGPTGLTWAVTWQGNALVRWGH